MNCIEGHENPPEAAFCSTCGKPLGQGGQPHPLTPPVAQTKGFPWGRAIVFATVAVVLVVGGVLGWLALDGRSGEAEGEAADAASSNANTFVVSGGVTVIDVDNTAKGWVGVADYCNFDDVCPFDAGAPCQVNAAGFGDIAAGAPVEVTDSSGEVIALGNLESGKTPYIPSTGEYDGPPCEFSFELSAVPDAGDIFGVQIGGRDSVSFTKDEAQALSLTLGQS